MPRLFVSLGSNRGSRIFNCLFALRRFAQLCMGEVVKTSPFYLTEPVNVPPQPWFVNCVAELEVTLSPRELLRLSQQVEAELGRTTKGDLSPRPIDIDLLFYDQRVVNTTFLEIPHPRLHQRPFVLRPLADIAPNYRHPTISKPLKDLLKEAEDTESGLLIPLSVPVSEVVKLGVAHRSVIQENQSLTESFPKRLLVKDF